MSKNVPDDSSNATSEQSDVLPIEPVLLSGLNRTEAPANPALQPVMHPALAAKLRALLSEPIAVPKTGNNVSQNYKFRETDVLISTLRPYFSKHGIIPFVSMVPESLRWTDVKTSRGSIPAAIVDFTCTFIDADTGCGYTVSLPGMGMDSGDKAINKAITVATRYMLQGPTMVATSLADPENDSEDQDASPGPHPTRATPQDDPPSLESIRDLLSELVRKSSNTPRPVDPEKALRAFGVEDLADLSPEGRRTAALQLKSRLALIRA